MVSVFYLQRAGYSVCSICGRLLSEKTTHKIKAMGQTSSTISSYDRCKALANENNVFILITYQSYYTGLRPSDGLPGKYITSGTPAEMKAEYAKIKEDVQEYLHQKNNVPTDRSVLVLECHLITG